MKLHDTREAWLVAAVKELRSLFEGRDKQPPPVQVSVGYGRGKGSKVHGICYPTAATANDLATIFISPEISAEKPVYLLGVLLHELIHAADNCESKHRGWFARTAKAMGLEGKMTCTEVGKDLAFGLEAMASQLGAYPHNTLNTALASIKAPDQNRQKKIQCSAGCAYILRGSNQVLDMGLPACAVCGAEMERA